MGVSTDALLMWGVHSPDEDEEENPSLDAVCERLNLDPEDGYWELIKELKNKYGCTLEVHQHCDYPQYVLTLDNQLSYRAWRGDPKVINIAELNDYPSRGQQVVMKKACAFLGWEYAPCWWLASYWG